MSDKFRILIKKGPNPGMYMDLTKAEITLGTDTKNDLVINDRQLSPFHAKLTKTPSGYTVENLGNANDTRVNGTRLQGAKFLLDGDQIEIGKDLLLEFDEVGTDGADASSADAAAAAHAEEHRKLFTRWFEELWNKKNYAITRELVDPEFTAHGAGGQEIKQGPDGVAGMVSIWHKAFPDGHMTMDDIITEGEMSVIRMTFKGTQTGEFYGVPASNKPVEVTSIGIDRVVGGKIREGWGELNMLGMMQQMGAIPSPEQSPAAQQTYDIEASITPEHVNEAYAALASGDKNRIRQYWADDMVWQVPGHNELSGWLVNLDEFLEFMGKVGEYSDHSFRMDLIAGKVLVTGDYSVDLTRNRGYRKGAQDKTMDIEVAHVLRWRDGKVIGGRGAIFGDGTTEYDQFWSRSPAVTPSNY